MIVIDGVDVPEIDLDSLLDDNLLHAWIRLVGTIGKDKVV